MVSLLSNYASWKILVGIVLLAFLITFLAFKIFRWLFSAEELEKFNDVTGIYVNMIGVLYGIFLAFIVIAIWENYNHVKENINKEADALGNIFRDANALDDSIKALVDTPAKQYIVAVKSNEWKLQKDGKDTAESQDAIEARADLQEAILDISPNDEGEQVVYDHLISSLNDLTVARRMRVTSTNAELPWILWALLIGGALVLIFYIACFYVPNRNFHMTLAFGVSGLIAVLLFIAISLNYPFVGPDGLSKTPFDSLSPKNHKAHKEKPKKETKAKEIKKDHRIKDSLKTAN